jgi:hypothetical protein
MHRGTPGLMRGPAPTWDDPKCRENIRKHGYDFPGCERIFDGPVWVYEDKRLAYGEHRLCAVGWLQGQVRAFAPPSLTLAAGASAAVGWNVTSATSTAQAT